MKNKKLSILAVYQVLVEYTDKDHIISQREFLDILKNEYEIEIDRRTLYLNLQMLEDFDIEISKYDDNGVGYYLKSKQFDEGEIFYLCNAIYSSPYVPSSYSKDLIERVLKTQSKYEKKQYEDLVYVENDRKKDNKDFFINLELISEAIKNRKVITFDYLTYNLAKKLVKKREKPYNISPYSLIQLADKTYMVGQSNNSPGHIVTFRVDKIKNVKFVDSLKYLHKTKDINPLEYARNHVYMYDDGDVNQVILKCDYSILDDVIDRFGKNIMIKDCGDNEHFLAYPKSSEKGMIYLALQYIEHMEILEPVEYRDAIKKALKNGTKKYKKEKDAD